MRIPQNVSFKIEYYCGPREFNVKFDAISVMGEYCSKDLQEAIDKAYAPLIEKLPQYYNEDGYIMSKDRE